MSDEAREKHEHDDDGQCVVPPCYRCQMQLDDRAHYLGGGDWKCNDGVSAIIGKAREAGRRERDAEMAQLRKEMSAVDREVDELRSRLVLIKGERDGLAASWLNEQRLSMVAVAGMRAKLEAAERVIAGLNDDCRPRRAAPQPAPVASEPANVTCPECHWSGPESDLFQRLKCRTCPACNSVVDTGGRSARQVVVSVASEPAKDTGTIKFLATPPNPDSACIRCMQPFGVPQRPWERTHRDNWRHITCPPPPATGTRDDGLREAMRLVDGAKRLAPAQTDWSKGWTAALIELTAQITPRIGTPPPKPDLGPGIREALRIVEAAMEAFEDEGIRLTLIGALEAALAGKGGA